MLDSITPSPQPLFDPSILEPAVLGLAECADAPNPVRQSAAAWARVLADHPNSAEGLQELQKLPYCYAQLSQWAQHLRLVGRQTEALDVFYIILALAPQRTKNYSELALQRHLTGMAYTLDLFDALLQRLSGGAITLEVARRTLRRAGVREYAVPLSPNGFGDQLLVGATAARLCEMLGLTFRGVLPLAARPGGRSSTLFTLPDNINALTGLDGLPRIERAEAWVTKLINASNVGSPMERVLTGFTLLIREHIANPPPGILCLEIPPLIPDNFCALLSGTDGNYLNNPFSYTIQARGANVARAHPTSSSHVPLFLIHLRLGDVTPLEGLVPGQVITPYLYDRPVPLEAIDNAPRRSRWQECIRLIHALRERFGASVRIALISDGLDRSFMMLHDPTIRSHLEHLGADMSAASLYSLEQEMRQRLQADFIESSAGLDSCIIGEDETAFELSLEQIKRADFCFSTSGHFVINAANHLRQPADPPLVFFCYQPEARFLVTPQHVQSCLLSGDANADVPRMVESVGTYWRSRSLPCG